MKEMREYKAKINDFVAQGNNAAAVYLDAAIKHREFTDDLRGAHQGVVEARLFHNRAKADVEGLKERSEAIIRQCEAEKEKAKEAKGQQDKLKTKAQDLQRQVGEMQAATTDEFRAEMVELSNEKRSEVLEAERDAEKATVDSLHCPESTMRDYERTTREEARLEKQMEHARTKINSIQASIDDLRVRWEPELDNVVESIHEAFRKSFEEISCMGEVKLHKDEDFSKWSLRLMVSFR